MNYLTATFVFSVLFSIVFLFIFIPIITGLVQSGGFGGVISAIFITFFICPILYMVGLIFFLGLLVA